MASLKWIKLKMTVTEKKKKKKKKKNFCDNESSFEFLLQNKKK